jgi:integrase
LRADEIQAFFKALQHKETPEAWRDFFTVALLTGARRSNVLAMKWADLELTRGLWRIPEEESKNKEPLLCILAPAAVEILKRRQADNAAQRAPSAYVFASFGASGHITEPKAAWKRIIDRAKIKDLRLHDLRRTLGSWQAAAGASLSIIGRSLGHKNSATFELSKLPGGRLIALGARDDNHLGLKVCHRKAPWWADVAVTATNPAYSGSPTNCQWAFPDRAAETAARTCSRAVF